MSTLRARLAAALLPSSVDDPAPQTHTRDGAPAYVRHGTPSAQRVTPPEDALATYWRQYETTPLVAAPIDQFADDVTAPGYRIKADDAATQAFLEDWAATCVIQACEPGHDLATLLAALPVHLLVRGTVLIEHVSAAEDPARLTALQLIKPETVTPYKRPDADLLVQPQDTDLPGVKHTPAGRAAAYVQYDRRHGYGPDDTQEARLAADEVTRLVRAPDIGDVFGTSAVEGVSERITAIKRKLASNEDAIESMAYGRWFFGFEPLVLESATGGDELHEWDAADMQAFVDDLDDLAPGDYLGHDGTISVENLPGETADIIAYLEFDVDYILSAMPAPKYAVGWEENINQFVSAQQEVRHDQRVADMRRDIERALTPVLRTVAAQHDYDPAGVALALEPAADDSPIHTLDTDAIERIERYARAVASVDRDVVSAAELRDLIFQLPARADVPDAVDTAGDTDDPPDATAPDDPPAASDD